MTTQAFLWGSLQETPLVLLSSFSPVAGTRGKTMKCVSLLLDLCSPSAEPNLKRILMTLQSPVFGMR